MPASDSASIETPLPGWLYFDIAQSPAVGTSMPCGTCW